MKCFVGVTDFHIEEETVVTIGKFDGRHKGHQKLFQTMKQVGEKNGYRIAVFTFDTPPAARISGQEQYLITTDQERKDNLESIGVDYLIQYPFTEEVMRYPAADFVKEILIEKMHAKAIVVGTDCGFGYKRSGNAELLQKLSEPLGYSLTVIEKEQEEHRDISSTYIKELIVAGEMEKAEKLLGQPYAIHGTVVHGNHLGSTVLGYPTANVIPPVEKLLPPFGVYVTRVKVNGSWYGGMTNIGRKPTIEGCNPVGVETHIFGLDEDLYGAYLEIQFLHFERPEKKFGSLEELKDQLKKDKEYGKSYLDSKNMVC